MEVDPPVVCKSDIEKLWGFLLYGTPRSVHMPREAELSRDCGTIIDRLIHDGLGKSVIKAVREAAGCSEHYDGEEQHVPASCLKYPLLYVLAVCIKSNSPDVAKEAYKCLTEVCGIPSHLFLFLNLYYKMCQRVETESQTTESQRVETQSQTSAGKKPCFSRGLRRAVGDWYTKKFEARRLAELVTKYRNRYEWNHKRLIKVAHLKPPTDDYGFVFSYILFGLVAAKQKYPDDGAGGQEMKDKVREVREFLERVELMRGEIYRQNDPEMTERLLEAINLGELKWQHLNTRLLKSPMLVRPLVTTMPPIALIRSLGRISAKGLLQPDSQVETLVCERLQKRDALLSARVHPLTVLTGICKYQAGVSLFCRYRWPVNACVQRALWRAFHLTFGEIRPTGRKIMIGINVNTTMQCPVIGSPAVSSEKMAVAVAKLLRDVESVAENPHVYALQFTKTYNELDLHLEDVEAIFAQLNEMEIAGTDCSIPFRCAREHNLPIDAFIIFTDLLQIHDGETLLRELENYQRQTGLQGTKLVIVSLSNSDLRIAQRENALHILGVDVRSLQELRNFISDVQNELSESLSRMGCDIR